MPTQGKADRARCTCTLNEHTQNALRTRSIPKYTWWHFTRMRSIYTAMPFAAASVSETAPRPSTRSSCTGVDDIEYVKIKKSRDL